jgi:uncharacterized membrane protein YqhA
MDMSWAPLHSIIGYHASGTMVTITAFVFQWSYESQRPVDLQFVGAREHCVDMVLACLNVARLLLVSGLLVMSIISSWIP